MSSGWDDGPLLGPVVSLVSPLTSAAGSRYPECVSGRVSVCVYVCVQACVRERDIDVEKGKWGKKKEGMEQQQVAIHGR